MPVPVRPERRYSSYPPSLYRSAQMPSPAPEGWRQRQPLGGGVGGAGIGTSANSTLSGIGGLGFHRETLFLSTSGVTHGACDLLGSRADKYNFCT